MTVSVPFVPYSVLPVTLEHLTIRLSYHMLAVRHKGLLGKTQ